MDSRLTELDRALYRLLHHHSVRAACHAQRWEVLNLQPEDLAALRRLDMQQVEQLATQIRAEVLERQHRGSGNLRTLFPGTIAAWREHHPDDAELAELTSRFMESDSYALYQEISPSPEALSLEEAFFRFCESHHIASQAVREDEFLTALARALVMNPRPAFAVPAPFRKVAAGWVAVKTPDPPKVYAAVKGRLITGLLSPFLAELLQPETDPESAAVRHHEDPPALKAAQAELAALGLLE